jgi:hypothetical protein
VYYDDVFKGLWKNKIRYLIIGGLAVNLHGIPRVTSDIDIIISTDKKNIRSLAVLLRKLGYVPRLPVKPLDLADPGKVREWIEERNMKAFNFYHSTDNYKSVDILLVHNLDFGKAFKAKSVKSIEGYKIYVASIADVIKTKLASGRPQDLSDIEMLKKAAKYKEDGK